MGRRGRKPDYVKREAFAKLMAEGFPPSERAGWSGSILVRASDGAMAGVTSGGAVLDLPPVIRMTRTAKVYSPRYLSEDERVLLGDLRRGGAHDARHCHPDGGLVSLGKGAGVEVAVPAITPGSEGSVKSAIACWGGHHDHGASEQFRLDTGGWEGGRRVGDVR